MTGSLRSSVAQHEAACTWKETHPDLALASHSRFPITPYGLQAVLPIQPHLVRGHAHTANAPVGAIALLGIDIASTNTHLPDGSFGQLHELRTAGYELRATNHAPRTAARGIEVAQLSSSLAGKQRLHDEKDPRRGDRTQVLILQALSQLSMR
ncbi:hypothetical protein JHW43_006527 [Diplocarpon mali]|nr:hypothetical protein JHW43_006527 [Diplocarpon mali]